MLQPPKTLALLLFLWLIQQQMCDILESVASQKSGDNRDAKRKEDIVRDFIIAELNEISLIGTKETSSEHRKAMRVIQTYPPTQVSGPRGLKSFQGVAVTMRQTKF